MRKIVAAATMSLDGVVNLEGNWHLPYFDEEVGREIGAAMSHSDALLMGRVNYEEWAAEWPQQDPERNPMAGFMNGVRKYVVSTTLEAPLEWNNSILISGDVVEEIASLKHQEGRNISVSGSATLAGFLLDNGLLDELRLTIPPVVVGRGRRFFENAGSMHTLKLEESKALGSGVQILVYRTVGSSER